MQYLYSKFLIILIQLFCFSTISAQLNPDQPLQKVYNTKKNFVYVSGGTGGGDYPFACFGLNLGRRFFNDDLMAGIGIHYIGNTQDGSGIGGNDAVQIFPVMIDLRQKFMGSRDGRFATLLIADAGYVFSITGNGEDAVGEYKFLNGWTFNPGIGFRYNFFENVGLMFDISWLHHTSPREWLPPVVQKDQR
ncbi:MAG: hypothetical protein WBP41_09435, partial [Saprospiraceae bacterium]